MKGEIDWHLLFLLGETHSVESARWALAPPYAQSIWAFSWESMQKIPYLTKCHKSIWSSPGSIYRVSSQTICVNWFHYGPPWQSAWLCHSHHITLLCLCSWRNWEQSILVAAHVHSNYQKPGNHNHLSARVSNACVHKAWSHDGMKGKWQTEGQSSWLELPVLWPPSSNHWALTTSCDNICAAQGIPLQPTLDSQQLLYHP